jgi:hypothetical protein
MVDASRLASKMQTPVFGFLNTALEVSRELSRTEQCKSTLGVFILVPTVGVGIHNLLIANDWTVQGFEVAQANL